MKSLKKCVTFIIITLLLLGLSHPIMAEDSSSENQGNGEDTQQNENLDNPNDDNSDPDVTPTEDENPDVIPDENPDLIPDEDTNNDSMGNDDSLTQGPLLGAPLRNGDPTLVEKPVVVQLRSNDEPTDGFTIEITFDEYEGHVPTTGTFNKTSSQSVEVHGENGKFIVENVEPWGYDYPTIVFSDIYVGQPYSVKLIGKEGFETSINYLCEAGRVKTSSAGEGQDNTVGCVARIGDAEDEDHVTNPSMINRVLIRAKEKRKYKIALPFEAIYRTAKGEIASSCQSGSSTSKNAIFHYSTEPYPASTEYTDWDRILFKQIGIDENKDPIIGYEMDNVTHYTTETVDVFEKTGLFEISSDLLTPGSTNRIYAWGATFNPDIPIKFWVIYLEIDDDGNLVSYTIYEEESQGSDLVEVDVLRLEESPFFTTGLRISNNTPSNPDEVFEYSIIIEPVSDYTGPYDVSGTHDQFYANQEYFFSLRHGESIEIYGMEIASNYIVTQKKKSPYEATSAIEINNRRMASVELQDDGERYVAEKVRLGFETNYVPIPNTGEIPPPTPCPPPVPVAPFRAVWNNYMKDNLKIVLVKGPAFPPVGEQYYADATYEGAEFKATGMNGIQLFAKTNERGVAVFEGIDPKMSYVIEEIREPSGLILPTKVVYYYRSGYDDETLFNWLNGQFYSYTKIEIGEDDYDPDENEYHKLVEEWPLPVRVEVRKFFLEDETQYEGPRFEFLRFVMDDSWERKDNFVDYRESIWPRSFFEDVEGVEFLMTLDSDPDNPAYRYHATTDEKGHAVFVREKPLEDLEPPTALTQIYYGKYTIYEVNTPDGMSPMEPMHVTVDPETRNILPETEQVYVARVINEPSKGDLKISKTVQGSKGDKNLNFNFTITLKDGEGVELPDEYNYEGSKEGSIKSGGAIQLKHNESVTIKNLPAGTQYEVVEEMVPNYETTVNGQKDNKSSGTIEDKKVKEVKYMNTSGDVPTPTPTPTPTNPPKTDPPTRYEVPNTYDPTNLNYGWVLLLGLIGIYISTKLLNKNCENMK